MGVVPFFPRVDPLLIEKVNFNFTRRMYDAVSGKDHSNVGDLPGRVVKKCKVAGPGFENKIDRLADRSLLGGIPGNNYPGLVANILNQS